MSTSSCNGQMTLISRRCSETKTVYMYSTVLYSCVTKDPWQFFLLQIYGNIFLSKKGRYSNFLQVSNKIIILNKGDYFDFALFSGFLSNLKYKIRIRIRINVLKGFVPFPDSALFWWEKRYCTLKKQNYFLCRCVDIHIVYQHEAEIKITENPLMFHPIIA